MISPQAKGQLQLELACKVFKILLMSKDLPMYKRNDHQGDNVNLLNYDVNKLDINGLIIFKLHLLGIGTCYHHLMHL